MAPNEMELKYNQFACPPVLPEYVVAERMMDQCARIVPAHMVAWDSMTGRGKRIGPGTRMRKRKGPVLFVNRHPARVLHDCTNN